jgi:signal transduction histidine kinase
MEPVRILLIEDDPGYVRLVRELMAEVRGQPYRIRAATTLAGGIELAKSGGDDVVLLDLGLPDSEGLEAVESVRAAAPRLPIVVLSGQDDVDTALESMRRGAQEYLVKGQAEHALLPRAIRYAIERKQTQDLEQLIVGIVGHDLRNPLNTITLAHQLLSRSPTLAREERLHLERIVRAAARATSLVRDLLDVTRLRQTGLLPIDRKSIDLASVVTQIVEEFRGAHPDCQVVNPSSDQPVVGAFDPERVGQALGNLLGNAAQHGLRGALISVMLTTTSDVAEISVHNFGPAIAPTLISRLFEPLARSPGAPERAGSIGLGLFIADHIVRAHGGSIRVTSDAERGTTFTMSLPRA